MLFSFVGFLLNKGRQTTPINVCLENIEILKKMYIIHFTNPASDTIPIYVIDFGQYSLEKEGRRLTCINVKQNKKGYKNYIKCLVFNTS